jgi:hypothetical protein
MNVAPELHLWQTHPHANLPDCPLKTVSVLHMELSHQLLGWAAIEYQVGL